MTSEDSTSGDITTYIELCRVADTIRTHFPSSAPELENLLDAVQEQLISKLPLETLEDVRRLPDVLHQATLIALLDRSGATGPLAASSDWIRLQIIGRPESVQQLLSDADVITGDDVVRWFEHDTG
jgi:hypothetical protein